MIIEAGKSYRTRSGARADVLYVLDHNDSNGDSIIGLLYDSEGTKEIAHWCRDGIFDRRQPTGRLDIVAHLIPRYGHHNDRVFIVGGPEIAKVYTAEFAQIITDALNAHAK